MVEIYLNPNEAVIAYITASGHKSLFSGKKQKHLVNHLIIILLSVLYDGSFRFSSGRKILKDLLCPKLTSHQCSGNSQVTFFVERNKNFPVNIFPLFAALTTLPRYIMCLQYSRQMSCIISDLNWFFPSNVFQMFVNIGFVSVLSPVLPISCTGSHWHMHRKW